MRVAELEDKLKGLQVTEEEMKAYHKVAAMMGGGARQRLRRPRIGRSVLYPVPEAASSSMHDPRLHRRPAVHDPRLHDPRLHSPAMHDPRLHDPPMLHHSGLHQ